MRALAPQYSASSTTAFLVALNNVVALTPPIQTKVSVFLNGPSFDDSGSGATPGCDWEAPELDSMWCPFSWDRARRILMNILATPPTPSAVAFQDGEDGGDGELEGVEERDAERKSMSNSC